jgi:hypothetical protein
VTMTTTKQRVLSDNDVLMLRALRRGFAQRSVALDLDMPYVNMLERLRSLRAAHRVTSTQQLLMVPAVRAELDEPQRCSTAALTPVKRADPSAFTEIELIVLTALRAGFTHDGVTYAQGWGSGVVAYTTRKLRTRFGVESTLRLLQLPVVRDAVRRAGGR